MITVSIYPNGKKMKCQLNSGGYFATGEGHSLLRAMLSSYIKLILKMFSRRIRIWREKWNEH